MNDTFLLIGEAVLVVMYLFYWPLVFKLTDTILDNQKRKKWVLIPMSIVNTIALLWASTLKGGSTYSYIILFVLLFLDFIILYKDSAVKMLFCASACVIHVMALRAFVTGIIAASIGASVYNVANQQPLFVWSIGISAAITNIAIVLVVKLIPAAKIRIINQHKEQQWFLIAWMSVFNVYLIFNSQVFWEKAYHPSLVGNEIIVSVAILLSLYIVVFFAFKTISLLGYKEKSAELQREIYQEQQFKSAATKDAIMTYEINITQDKLLRGFEIGEEELGVMSKCYSEILGFMSRRLIYSEDIEKFLQYGSRASLTREFEEGKSESTIEYRRLTDSGDYIWVRAVTNLTQGVECDDIIAFVLIKDIEIEKQHQLKLQYKAERDQLTGLYNKEMTGKLINEALRFSPAQSGSALFMIDADNFKEVNDKLGHIYGDAVLCELAEKLQRVFRTDDIVGRVGGDEFIAFMREGASKAVVDRKANEICKAFYTAFNGDNDESFVVTSSVGISVSPRDGESFEKLYRYADIALYEAKSKGKNTFVVYTGNDFAGYRSNRNEIPQFSMASSKSFRQNRIEYIFKILYQSENPVTAIHSVLELVTSHFSFERGYIFEMSKDGKTTSNTFEWCAEGIEPHIDFLQNIPIDTTLPSFTEFLEKGLYIMSGIEDSPPMYSEMLKSTGIKLMIQFGIFDHGRLLGQIGFGNRENDVLPSDAEIDEMKTICNILATFFVKHRIAEESVESLRALTEVMNNFDNFIYVIDPKTFKVLFMNEKMREFMSYANTSEPCYSFFRGNSSQCADCPLIGIDEIIEPEGAKNQPTALEFFNETRNVWLEASFSYLRWTDGSTACLINCLDITEKRKGDSGESLGTVVSK